jgi:hypothetical protein
MISNQRVFAAAAVAVLALAGCGGGDRAPSPLAQADLRLEADVYENSMPQAIFEGQAPQCSQLIVSLVLRAGPAGFPDDFHVDGVTLTHAGATWTKLPLSGPESSFTNFVFDASGSIVEIGGVIAPPGGHLERVFYGRARGCPPSDDLPENTALGIEVPVSSGPDTATLKTTPPLGFAS